MTPVQPGRRRRWCRLAAGETAADCQVTAELHYRDGYTAAWTLCVPPSPARTLNRKASGATPWRPAQLAFLDLYPSCRKRSAPRQADAPLGDAHRRPARQAGHPGAGWQGKTPEEAESYAGRALLRPAGPAPRWPWRPAPAALVGPRSGWTRGTSPCMWASPSAPPAAPTAPLCSQTRGAELFPGGALCGGPGRGDPGRRRHGAESRACGVRTFYMGGGTPTTLTAEQMDAVLTALEESFDLSALSGDHRGGRPAGHHHRGKAGGSEGPRRRPGVASTPRPWRTTCSAAIGRRHTAGGYRRGPWSWCGPIGFAHVNMDLIAGLPEDTPEGFRRSLDRCLDLGRRQHHRPHPGAEKGQPHPHWRGCAIPGRSEVAGHAGLRRPRPAGGGLSSPTTSTGRSICPAALKTWAGAVPAAECWYNVDIMSELCSILSFGAGGSTKMVEPGTNHIERVFNLKYPKEYTERPEKFSKTRLLSRSFIKNTFPKLKRAATAVRRVIHGT